MMEFGFPASIASASAAGPVMVIGQVRDTIMGLLVFLFYSRNQLEMVDTVMAVKGAYSGLVDSYIVWKEGNPRIALLSLHQFWTDFGLGLRWLDGGWKLIRVKYYFMI